MLRLAMIALVAFFSCPSGALAQADLYDINSVREIRITFSVSNWDAILDSLFIAGDDGRLLGDLEIDGALIPDVGVRYKGYSSFGANRVKNPFNIKLNYVHTGQKYQGVDKIKLSNVIQDPSFLRETLSYEIARKYMPASLANYANVYVNDTLIGLYTNVEDVNKEFVDKHFGSRNNTFFKGNPTTVNINGENSNLSDGPGPDSTQYYSLYSIESDHGWGELLQLIDTLNNDPQAIETLLNVDRTLWMHAFNNALINFDSYVGYAQNYYLFKDDNDRWNPILWDLNMSFASFRLSDASLFWNGFSIGQAITMDPLMHHNNPSVFPRPLMRNLFIDPTYRRMYLAHLRTIIEENFANNDYFTRAVYMRSVIANYVVADTNKFYSDQDFLDNLDQTVFDLIDYPGITELMDQRTNYLSGYTGFSGEPSIANIDHSPQMITIGSDLAIVAQIIDADTAILAYRAVDGGLFLKMEMKDDGLNDDGTAGDGVYGARITAESNTIQFYIYAENDSAGAFSPHRAAYEYHTIIAPVNAGDLVINELMAFNEGHVFDDEGEADDWLELYNASTFALNTGGLFLSDDAAELTKWAMPSITLEPGEYLIIWADGQEGQGIQHAGFKLDASGESLFLSSADSTVIDRVTYSTQFPISTWGRLPNGSGTFRELFPTFNARNSTNDIEVLSRYVHLYPNPSNGDVFAIVRESGPFDLQLIGPDGKQVTPEVLYTSNELIRMNTTILAAGTYTLQVRTADHITQQNLVIIK